MPPEAILDFWFGAPPEGITPRRRKLWFGKRPATDALIRARFMALHQEAMRGALRH